MQVNGDKRYFAIQWEIDFKIDRYTYGFLCFWADNIRIGDYEHHTTISICLSFLKDFLNEKGDRSFEGSINMNKEDLFYVLYEQAYDPEHPNSYEEIAAFENTFWLDAIGERSIRDSVGIILIDEKKANRQRLIWKDLEKNEIKEAFFPLLYFETIAQEFLRGACNEINLRFQ
jgi:hypothetical protein